MNEITIQGNLTAAPVLRYGTSSKPFVTFTVAINRSYYHQGLDRRIDQPTVFLEVIAFNNLAENAAKSLLKGTTVTVTGYLADSSYTHPETDQRIRRTRLEAGDIAISLRFATAEVIKRSATSADDAPADDAAPADEPEPISDEPEPAKPRRSTKATRAAASA